MTPARILILTNGHLCRNPRVLKEASALAAANYDVTVLGVSNHAASEDYDRELVRRASFRHLSIDMLPGSRGDHSVEIGFRRLQLWLARQVATRFKIEWIESLGPAGALLRAASAIPAVLTIVHNEVPHWVGTRLLAAGRRVAADIEDWHSEDLLPDARAARPLALLRRVERQLLQRAIYTSTTSHALANALHARYGGMRPHVITNSFPLHPLPLRRPAETPAFFWFSQTLGPGRGLESFLAAWGLTRQPSRLVLLGESRDDIGARLLSGLPPEHRSRATLLPLVAPDKLPEVIARHDIGLALETPEILSRDLTITNKILQYLNAGLAIVASNTAGQREVLALNSNAGLLVGLGNPTELAAVLDGLLADRPALAARQAAARGLAERVYSWERESPQLLRLVELALATPPGKFLPQ